MSPPALKLRRQHTLAQAVALGGIGVHSGAAMQLTIAPAPVDCGIVFVRADLAGAEVPARCDLIEATAFGTVLKAGHASVATVEHLMAALHAAGIDNARISLDGPEVPIMDGSALPFLTALRQAGRLAQARPRTFLALRHPLEVREGSKFVRLLPAARFALTTTIRFPHPRIGTQYAQHTLAFERFAAEIAPARTFGFLPEVEALRARGYARGGSLANAVVLDKAEVLNPEGLRFADEFVRHKLLDAVGDLYLAGAPLLAHYIGDCPGHTLHAMVLRKLMSQPDTTRKVWQREDGGVLPVPPERGVTAPALDIAARV